MSTLDVSKTANLDLIMRQGTPWSKSFQLATSAGAPINLAGCGVRGQVRARADSATVAGTIVGAITDAATGTFTLSQGMTESEVQATSGAPSQATPYVYDAEIYDLATGAPKYVIAGSFGAKPRVTKVS